MRRSSPIIAAFGTPLMGMDAREDRPPNAPAILFNVDLSHRGVFKERPGLQLRGGKDRTGNPPPGPLMGLHVFQHGGRTVLVGIYAPSSNANMRLQVFNLKYTTASNYYLQHIYDEYLDDRKSTKDFYDFAQSGPFLFFCNGRGSINRLEWISNDETGAGNWDGFEIKRFEDYSETGVAPLVMSYITSGLKPSSLNMFNGQVLASGLLTEQKVSLSNPIDEDSELARELTLNATRDSGTFDGSFAFVSEVYLPGSFPLGDASGYFHIPDESIVASIAVQDDFYIFTERSLYKVVGFGSQAPRPVWMADVSLVSPRAMCDVMGYLFFVAHDGCYIVNEEQLQKISYEMDPLWKSESKAETTRTVQANLRRTAYPFFVNRRLLRRATCVNDRDRKQVMVALPSTGFSVNNMVWVWNYSGMMDGSGPGKWSIWGGGEESFRGPNPTAIPISISGIATGSPTTITTSASHNLVTGYPVKISGSTMTAINGTHAGVAVTGATTFTIPVNTGGMTGSGGYVYPPLGLTSNQDVAGTSKVTAWHADCMAVERTAEHNRVFIGSNDGYIYILGDRLDRVSTTFASGSPNPVRFPLYIGLGRVVSPDVDGRAVFTDIGIRRLQKMRNLADDTKIATLDVSIQSEGEADKYISTQQDDVEFSETVGNMQDGLSVDTKSVIATTDPSMYLGGAAGEDGGDPGTSSPLLSPVYIQTYARVNVPDGEGRGAVVDLYSSGVVGSDVVAHNIHIKDIWVHASVKGGSQRDPS
tara:strand:- start:91 stop:2361 length:2271 start_codon:yes stop_codon:yes gene_type:complete